MKKNLKIILIILAIVLVVSNIFAFIDYNRALKGKKPIFVINAGGFSGFDVEIVGAGDNETETQTNSYNFQEYKGLGYKILTCESISYDCGKSAYLLSYGVNSSDIYSNILSKKAK